LNKNHTILDYALGSRVDFIRFDHIGLPSLKKQREQNETKTKYQDKISGKMLVIHRQTSLIDLGYILEAKNGLRLESLDR